MFQICVLIWFAKNPQYYLALHLNEVCRTYSEHHDQGINLLTQANLKEIPQKGRVPRWAQEASPTTGNQRPYLWHWVGSNDPLALGQPKVDPINNVPQSIFLTSRSGLPSLALSPCNNICVEP